MNGWNETFAKMYNDWMGVAEQTTKLLSDGRYYVNELEKTVFDGKSRHQRENEEGRPLR